MKPSNEIRIIVDEIKELKRYRNTGEVRSIEREKYLEAKYEEIDILFGHENTLDKAIIFYLDQNAHN